MQSTSVVSRQHGVQIGWRFWLRWVIGNTLGFGIGFPVGVMMLVQNEGIADIGVSVLVGILSRTLIGLSVGFMQWLALHPVLPDARWVMATGIGWATGVGISAVLTLAGTPVSLPLEGMIGLALAYGTGAGVLQALVLQWSMRRAAVWVLISAAGWAAGWVLWIPLHSFFTLLQQEASIFASVFAVGATVGTVSGIITGLALPWLLRPSE